MIELKLASNLKHHVQSHLSGFDVRQIPSRGRHRAAVAFVLTNCMCDADIAQIPHDPSMVDQAAFILTTRSDRLRKHRGQRAFPGGRIDPGESAEQAALRELDEEIGLRLHGNRVLGRLDDYATRSGYVITPVVIWAGSDPVMQANPDEVASIHPVPLAQLLRDDAPLLDTIPESRHPVLRMPLGDEWFAAPSAAIAFQFREVALLGRSTRVAHFDQPYFAWG